MNDLDMNLSYCLTLLSSYHQTALRSFDILFVRLCCGAQAKSTSFGIIWRCLVFGVVSALEFEVAVADVLGSLFCTLQRISANAFILYA